MKITNGIRIKNFDGVSVKNSDCIEKFDCIENFDRIKNFDGVIVKGFDSDCANNFNVST